MLITARTPGMPTSFHLSGGHAGSVLAPQKARGAAPPKTWLGRLRGTGGRRANDISAKAGGRSAGLNTRAEETRTLLQRQTEVLMASLLACFSWSLVHSGLG